MAPSLLSPTIRLRDTLTRSLVEFRAPGKIRMYVCGLTVYDYAHVGHARTILVFDVLYRLLEAKGFDVKYVQNFTDVDDKIIARAEKEGVEPREIAERFIKETLKDFELLNVKKPVVMPRATEHIRDMQKIISALIEKGYAYVTPSGVYFDVAAFPGYGKLSKMRLEQLVAGARVEPDPYKRSPADFALWKIYSSGPLWDSPWGKGRPGWHIECSTMIHVHLGETIDIHGGGSDLIFPHHENEIAQSEAYTGKPLARAWVHVGMLQIRREKMAKSLGNIVRIRDAVKWWGPNTLRLFLLSSHYRSPLELDLEPLRKAYENWRIIESAAYDLREQPPRGSGEDAEAEETLREFDSAISNDLDTPLAITALVKLSRRIGRLRASGRLEEASRSLKTVFDLMFGVLGFRLPEISAEEEKMVRAMVEKRARLRAEKRFEEADRIRDELRAKGYELVDIRDQTLWRKVERPDWSKTF